MHLWSVAKIHGASRHKRRCDARENRALWTQRRRDTPKNWALATCFVSTRILDLKKNAFAILTDTIARANSHQVLFLKQGPALSLLGLC